MTIRALLVPHFVLLSLIALLLAMMGFGHALALLHIAPDAAWTAQSLLQQIFSGAIDFLFPVILLLMTVALLPTEIGSGLIRVYLTAPISRHRLFIYHVLLLYVVTLTFISIYLTAA